MDHFQTYISDLHQTLDEISLSDIQNMVDILLEARLSDRQVFVMGNGGSATTASHFVADLSKNTRVKGLPHFRVVGLTDNIASITAYANDEGYDRVFAQQLAGLMKPNDIIIGISASGNSPNVLRAIEFANQGKATTIGLTGFNGGLLRPLVNLNIHVPSNRIEQVEDIHLMVEHMVISSIKDTTQNSTFVDQINSIFIRNKWGLQPRSAAAEADTRPIRETYDLLGAISKEMNNHGGFYDLLHRILQLTVDSIGASSGSFLVVDAEGNVTDGLLAYGGQITASPKKELANVFKEGLAGWVYKNQQSVLVADTRGDPRWLPRAWEEGPNSSRSVISVPLIAQNKVTGLLTLARNHNGQFNEADLSLLTSVAVFLTYQIFTRLKT